ncbi:MAG: Rne/Rng family ribonuclease [Bdellovibrionota bacterium]
MSKSILINSTLEETRIAILENSRVTDLLFERSSDKGIIGNIYKGKVVRVLPGMQAAFVDIGHERAAFLYAGDFYHSKHHSEDFEDEDEPTSRRRRASEDIPPINELVREGQEILVQVAKGPIGTKGARLTCHLSLPGRFLVFMPSLKHNGVSRKIESYDQRKRLKKIIDQHRPKEGGFIVRTAAGGGEMSEKQIKNDVDYLQNLWSRIGRKFKSNPAPKLLHYDLDITTRLIRDQLDEEIDYMLIDSKVEHRKILKFIKTFNPSLRDKIELYQDPTPLFDRFDVESEIHRSLSKRVWLKSGGYLIIEHTEALTSIDVNTGRFVGKKTLEETILKTNLEAAEEIVRQLRLRNIGGIIIIDFIDMEKDNSKDQVYRYLDKLVREDKQKTSILRISNLGLVEMTRKRSREPLHRYLTQQCPECDGRAFVKNPMTLAHQALRDIRRELPHLQGDHLYLGVHPSVYEVLTKEESQAVINLEKQFQKGIRIESRPEFHIEQISINPQGAPKLKGAKLSPISYIQKLYGTPIELTPENDEDYSDEEYQNDVEAISEKRAELKFEIKKEDPSEDSTVYQTEKNEENELDNSNLDLQTEGIPEAPLMRKENEVFSDEEDEDESDDEDEGVDENETKTKDLSSADKALG